MKAKSVLVLLLLVLAGAANADEGKVVPVHFAAGKSAATVNGTVRGHGYVDYQIDSRAGQLLSVDLKSKHTQCFFNVLPPGSRDVALYNSSNSGNKLSKRLLPADGNYTVRVYLMRAAAGRDETAQFSVQLSVTGKPLASLPDSEDAMDEKGYHASGPVSCSYYLDKNLKTCEAGVIRRGHDGTATVVLTAKA